MALREQHQIALHHAMEKLLAGDPGEPDQKWTFDNLVLLSGVPRSTAFRDAAFRREWKERRAAARAANELEQESVVRIRKRGGRKRESSQVLRQTIALLANHIQALTLQNDELTRKLAEAKVRAMSAE